jgi:large subunit ribosomal protein L9
MEVILLEKIQNLGGLGEVVKVKPGFARNYLVPQGRALPATAQNQRVFEERRAELEAQQVAELDVAKKRAATIEEVKLRLERRAGGGRLFGSVGAPDIADALAAAGVEVHRSEIRLPEGPIRQTGAYTVRVHVHPDVPAEVEVVVAREGGEEEERERVLLREEESERRDDEPESEEAPESGSSEPEDEASGETP